MLVLEAAGIGSLARRLDLNEADQGVSAGDGVVRPRLESASEVSPTATTLPGGNPVSSARFRDEAFQRRAQLVFGRTARAGIRELQFRFGAKLGYGFLKCHARPLALSDRTAPQIPDHGRRHETLSLLTVVRRVGLRADRRDKLLKWLDTGGENWGLIKAT